LHVGQGGGMASPAGTSIAAGGGGGGCKMALI